MQLTAPEIESKVIAIVQDMVEELDVVDTGGPITTQSQLIEDLSFASIDFVQLFVLIEEALQKKLGFHNLILRDGVYVDDLSIAELVTYIDQAMTVNGTTTRSSDFVFQDTQPPGERLTLAKVEQFKGHIPSPQIHIRDDKNTAPIVFILCPSRSGSTLLRIMLGGHSMLFAPPELHLLTYDSLEQRRESLSDELNRHLLNGSIRAIMGARPCDAVEAEAYMDSLEAKNLSTREFYQYLQGWLGDKILVDKTPSYAYHLNILRRAETEFFHNAYYLHLVRHPYGTMRSFEDAQLDRLVPFMRDSGYSRRECAEMAWLICHQNILEFLKSVPLHRQFRLKFEDLVTDPETSMEEVCDFLDIDFEASMLEPYEEKQKRMTDGVRAVSKMSGDLKFHLHKGIDPDMAERWKHYYTEDFLGTMTWELAESMGYVRC
jgi:acyl carrier protein